MAATWIVSANASRARVFAQLGGTAGMEEVAALINDAARLRSSDLETDRMGPTSGTGSTHNTGGATPNKLYQPRVTPEQHENQRFARDLCDFLLKAAQEGRYQELDLIASPQFLGAVRQLLDPQVKSRVKIEIDKDYTHLSAQALLDEVRNRQRPM